MKNLLILLLVVSANLYSQSGIMDGLLEKNGTVGTLTIATLNSINSTAVVYNTPSIDITRPSVEAGHVNMYIYPQNSNYSGYMNIRGYNTGCGRISLGQVRGSYAAPAFTASGSNLGQIYFGGAIASTNSTSSSTYIYAKATENFSSTTQGAILGIYTCRKTTATAVEVMRLGGNKPIPDNTATTIFNAANAAGESGGLVVQYTIKTVGGAGNESHTEIGELTFMFSNDGAVTTSINKEWSRQHKSDAGAYTVTFSATNASPSVISVTADSELDVASVITYNITEADGQVITDL